ncbi:hypothetical protein KHO57_gp160 [Mycobacterium phage Phabba]|uniref:Uncharacterized protein n=1 Tax=Mycobacterium phage Phabba TaxID=2027899 RepID=A0A249XU41_9CAUD|nr:hypothetical protein KHO57_gp160 [Mycobacterium phage Phabba]ASZ74744.1 hypothetical protein SEA_PHABBA_205 [Mycobacterium phage Phabba]
MPDSPTEHAFYIALKFTKGVLDTTDGRSGYRYKPGARMYPTKQPASAMRRRWLGEGYEARLAKFTIDEDGNPHVEYCDQDDNIAPVCGAQKTRQRTLYNDRVETVIEKRCVLDLDHTGLHSTTRDRGYRNRNDFAADNEHL